MSQSTHRAIAGMQGAEQRAHDRCSEAIQRYGEVRTASDFDAVLTWAKQYGWFFRSVEDSRALLAAHTAAKRRIAVKTAHR